MHFFEIMRILFMFALIKRHRRIQKGLLEKRP